MFPNRQNSWRAVWAIVAISALAPCTPASTAQSDSTISGAGIGTLRLGMAVADVRHRFSVRSDAIELNDEGLPQRVLRIVYLQRELVAKIDGAKISSLEIAQPGFSTPNGIDVGSSLSILLAKEQDWERFPAEGLLYVTSRQSCGISFRLSYALSEEEHGLNWDWQRLSRLPRETRVEKIVIFGCTR